MADDADPAEAIVTLPLPLLRELAERLPMLTARPAPNPQTAEVGAMRSAIARAAWERRRAR